jgi:hypothetical protein
MEAMMSTARVRKRFQRSSGYWVFKQNNTVLSQIADPADPFLTDYCADIQGNPKNDNSLTIQHLDVSDYHPWSGSLSQPPYSYSYVGGYYGGVPSLCSQHASGLPVPNTSALLTKAIALTNPSRPGVTPLTLLQDIVEMPKQLKDVGKLIKTPKRLLSLREIANQNLAIRFGWLPLIQDVKDLLSFQDHVHQRAGELNRLYSSSGLHRRIRLGHNACDQERNVVLASSNSGLQGDTRITSISRQEIWATVRWYPTSAPPFDPSDAGRIKAARKLVSGMTVEGLLNGLWEVIPWTWIVDWFTDIHGYAMGASNTIPALPKSACLMVDTKTEHSVFTSKSGFYPN